MPGRKTSVLLLLLSVLLAAQAHSVTLTWTWTQGTGEAATGFKVYRKQTSGGTLSLIHTIGSPAIMTYVDTAVSAGRTYYYAVTAYNGGGESAPTPDVAATIPASAPPASPANLNGHVN